MKILILTTYFRDIIKNDPEYFKESTGKLFLHLEKKHDVELALFSQLSLKITNSETKILFNDKDLKSYDRIIIRSINFKKLNYEWLAQVVSNYVKNNNIRTINSNHFIEYGCSWNKMYQTLLFVNNNLPIPNTYVGKVETHHLPLISKPLLGSHGNGIYLVDSLEKVSNENNIMYQELLPDREDYRVIVLGNKVLGVMLRKAVGNNLISNISAGGEAIMAELDDEMERISVKVAKLCKLDLCGVDLMKDNHGKYRILEVNRNPEFNGFEKATKINVPKAIEKFLIKD